MVENSGATLNLNNLTIAHGSGGGFGSPADEGGAILNSGTLTVTNCTLSDNNALGSSNGGAIYNSPVFRCWWWEELWCNAQPQ